ncbi:TRAF-like [Sesbania bispinosa]|nr:TRAF-like [Sesbania bispinosa]
MKLPPATGGWERTGGREWQAAAAMLRGTWGGVGAWELESTLYKNSKISLHFFSIFSINYHIVFFRHQKQQITTEISKSCGQEREVGLDRGTVNEKLEGVNRGTQIGHQTSMQSRAKGMGEAGVDNSKLPYVHTQLPVSKQCLTQCAVGTSMTENGLGHVGVERGGNDGRKTNRRPCDRVLNRGGAVSHRGLDDDGGNRTTNQFRGSGERTAWRHWRILVYPLRKDVNHFSLHLMVADSLPPYGWSRNTFFKLALINQVDKKKSVIKETQQKFKGEYRSWGSFFLNLNDFYDHKKGYLLRDTCIIKAHICVSDFPPKIIQDINYPLNPNSSTPTPDSRLGDQATDQSSDERDTISPRTSGSSPREGEIQGSDLTLKELIDLESFKTRRRSFHSTIGGGLHMASFTDSEPNEKKSLVNKICLQIHQR